MSCGTASGIAMALILAGCSGLAQKDPDPSPVNPTAVTEVRLISQGTRDFPAFGGATRTFTRAKMRRSESTVSGDGAYARYLDGNGVAARIERLDRKLEWTLDAKNKQYTECPLRGCPAADLRKPQQRKPAAGDRDTECRLKVGTKTFSVEQTGRKRSINGFDTEQYAVEWLVTFRDNASRSAASALTIDLWTTSMTPGLKETLALEQKFAHAHDAIPGLADATDRTLVLPVEVSRMLNGYLERYVSPVDRSNLLAGLGKLDKVQGQPILANVTWRFTGAACSLDDAMKDLGDRPLLTFSSEVKSIRLETAHDSLFAIPKGYKITK
jgi:hypothetical protein